MWMAGVWFVHVISASVEPMIHTHTHTHKNANKRHTNALFSSTQALQMLGIASFEDIYSHAAPDFVKDDPQQQQEWCVVCCATCS